MTIHVRWVAALRPDLVEGPGTPIALHLLAAFALEDALDREVEVGPHRLRAEVAAPNAAGQRVHQEQHEGGDDHQAGDVIDFLRPDLDEEEVEATAGKVEQDRLVRLAGRTRPAQERQQIVDRHADHEDRPLQAAERARHRRGIDLLLVFVEAGAGIGTAIDTHRIPSLRRGPRQIRRIDRPTAHVLGPCGRRGKPDPAVRDQMEERSVAAIPSECRRPIRAYRRPKKKGRRLPASLSRDPHRITCRRPASGRRRPGT